MLVTKKIALEQCVPLTPQVFTSLCVSLSPQANTLETNTNSILPDSQLLQKEIAFMQDIITRKEAGWYLTLNNFNHTEISRNDAEWSKLETQIQQVNKELSSCIPYVFSTIGFF